MTVRVVEKRGPDEGPVIVLVHGLGVGAGYWDLPFAGYSTMDYLVGRGLRAFALENRGYGCSSHVPGSSVRAKTAVQDLIAVIEFVRRCSGKGRVCLVGHSWGGMVVSMAAAIRQDCVQSVVLIGMPYRRLHPCFRERLGQLRAGCAVADGWVRNPTHRGLEARLYDYDPQALRAYHEMVEGHYPGLPVGILDDCEELPHADSMGRLSCPTLVVCGTLETVVDRGDMLDLLDDLPAAEKDLVLVGNVGHLAGIERLAHRRVDRVVADWSLEHARGGDAPGDGSADRSPCSHR